MYFTSQCIRLKNVLVRQNVQQVLKNRVQFFTFTKN